MQRDPQENMRRLYQTAATQSGYFTSGQAQQAGYAYSQHHYHVSRGNWLRVGHGIFRLRNFPPGEREDLVRWSLWSRNQKGVPQAIVSHDTALTVHALSDVMPELVHLIVPPGFRKKVPPGCVLHTANLTSEDIESRTGYQVTTPLRTLLDVANSPLSQEHINKAVQDALERGLVRRRALADAPCSPTARYRLDQATATVQQEES